MLTRVKQLGGLDLYILSGEQRTKLYDDTAEWIANRLDIDTDAWSSRNLLTADRVDDSYGFDTWCVRYMLKNRDMYSLFFTVKGRRARTK